METKTIKYYYNFLAKSVYILLYYKGIEPYIIEKKLKSNNQQS